jgi:hypothetical protein
MIWIPTKDCGLDLGAGVIALFSVITVALVAMTRAGSLQIALEKPRTSHD